MKIRAISHIKYNGKIIDPGKTIDLPEGVGAHLIKSGSAEAVKEATDKKNQGGQKNQDGKKNQV